MVRMNPTFLVFGGIPICDSQSFKVVFAKQCNSKHHQQIVWNLVDIVCAVYLPHRERNLIVPRNGFDHLLVVSGKLRNAHSNRSKGIADESDAVDVQQVEVCLPDSIG